MNHDALQLSIFSLAFTLGCGASTAEPALPRDSNEPVAVDQASIEVTPELGHPHVGDDAPDFELSGADNTSVRLSALRGAPVMLAFVASWCPFSQAEQPQLAQLGQDYALQGVKTVAVVVADTEAGYQTYRARIPMGIPILFDPSGDIARAYAPAHAQPTQIDRRKVVVTANLVVDAQGAIRSFVLLDGKRFDPELTHVRRTLDMLLDEPGASAADPG